MAGKRTAAALKAKGYDYRFVFSLKTRHCDGKVFEQTLADTLVWIWRGYQEIVQTVEIFPRIAVFAREQFDCASASPTICSFAPSHSMLRPRRQETMPSSGSTEERWPISMRASAGRFCCRSPRGNPPTAA